MHTANANTAEDRDIEWDEREAEFARARSDKSLMAPLRDAFANLDTHAQAFNAWHEGKLNEEWQMNAVLGPAEEAEINVCLALRRFRAGTATADELVTSIVNARLYYLNVMNSGIPQR